MFIRALVRTVKIIGVCRYCPFRTKDSFVSGFDLWKNNIIRCLSVFLLKKKNRNFMVIERTAVSLKRHYSLDVARFFGAKMRTWRSTTVNKIWELTKPMVICTVIFRVKYAPAYNTHTDFSPQDAKISIFPHIIRTPSLEIFLL